MNRLWYLPLIAIVGLIAACGSANKAEIDRLMAAPMHVEAQANEDADFSGYRTWTWVKRIATTGDPRLDDIDLRRSIGVAVEYEMRSHGYEYAADGAADLVMNGHLALKPIHKDELAEYYSETYGEYAPEWKGQGNTFEEGTLVLFMFDAKTRGLVWTGQVQTETAGRVKLPEDKRRERINQAVKLLMEDVPRAGS